MKTFLIVDDCPTNNLVLKNMLKRIIQDCVVEVAVSGEDVIAKFNNMTVKPDIVFTDFSMPPYNGDEVIRDLRNKFHYTGLIFLITAYDITDIPHCDYNVFLKKPIIFNEFKDILSTINVLQ